MDNFIRTILSSGFAAVSQWLEGSTTWRSNHHAGRVRAVDDEDPARLGGSKDAHPHRARCPLCVAPTVCNRVRREAAPNLSRGGCASHSDLSIRSYSLLQQSVLFGSANAYIRAVSEKASYVRADVGIRAPILPFS